MANDTLITEHAAVKEKIENLKIRKSHEISQEESAWIDRQLAELAYYENVFSAAVESAL
jgi:hypothetical protein